MYIYTSMRNLLKYCEIIIISSIPIFDYQSMQLTIQRIFVIIYAYTHYNRLSTNLLIHKYRICSQTTKIGIHEIK
jgi:hypothetical protein